jgi:hypothetical protein
MKRVNVLLVVLSVCMMVETASAAKNVWRECGIGGMLFKETGWAAIVSNIIWDLGSTATSSNMSSADLCEGKAASTAQFVNETYANLEEETAVGSGTHLVTMLDILGCDQAVHAPIINSMRSDLQQRMASPGYSSETKMQKAEAYYNGLMNNAAVHAKECQMI